MADRSSSRRRSRNDAPPQKSELRQWIEAIVVAVVVVLVIRTFFFDLFRIPTPSMENNLLVGDYLFVSKLHYGTRLPMTLAVPFGSAFSPNLYLDNPRFPYVRLPGFGSVERGDAVVFNLPPDDAPIDRKMHYIKRVVGMPGDTLAVSDKAVSINSDRLSMGQGMQYFWVVRKSDPRYQVSRSELEELGISAWREGPNGEVARTQATAEAALQIRSWDWVDAVEPLILNNANYDANMYPPNQGYTPDNYGPIAIPAAGTTVTLNEDTWPVYEPVITEYEGHAARPMTDSTYAIDGEETTEYTFEQDYYFMLGDNRDDSEDSRFWGFVPHDHIVGKALFTYFSWDAESTSPRFNRILRPIQDAEVFESAPYLRDGELVETGE
ncbi:signal peptidase I [Longimonas halophila]|uniref:signal peptidase I n=1 Tax=Longimonas halophila TaxID=1469170 RepID=UPI001FE3DFE9|nr:signal peptidase I [Longimonas halophila]